MVIKTTKGYYEVLKNVRDALNIQKFEDAYLEEYFDSYDYIVGDIASELLRLKGFNSKDYSYRKIPEYLAESCVYKCGFFILRRINEEEYKSLFEYYKENPNKELTIGDDHVTPIEKVNYDKDSLVLESTKHVKPNIVLDMNRINKVKTFPLPSYLKDDKDDIKDSKKGTTNNKFNKPNQNKNQINNNQNKNQINNQNKNQINNNQNRNQMTNNSFKNNNHHKKNKNKGGNSNGQQN